MKKKNLLNYCGLLGIVAFLSYTAACAKNEQHPQCCYGDCFKRSDLRITSYRKGCCQATAAFLFREVIKKS